jgi:RNA polymerase sigma-70 factor (ECF subfamily)
MTARRILREMLAEARSRWPSISVTPEDYERFCTAICGNRSLEELRAHAADLYLCCACAQQQTVALQVFEREAEAAVRGAIMRVCRDAEFVRETLQEFWKKLLSGPDAKVHDYRGRGPLQAWLRVAAARLAIDRSRAKQAIQVRETQLGDLVADQVFGPESTLTRVRFTDPFREALLASMAELSSKERNLLRMHVQGRCSIDQIGRAYGVHRATAARWLDHVKAHILQTVRTRLQLTQANLTDSEFQSVARVVGKDLELGLSASPTGDAHEYRSSMR